MKKYSTKKHILAISHITVISSLLGCGGSGSSPAEESSPPTSSAITRIINYDRTTGLVSDYEDMKLDNKGRVTKKIAYYHGDDNQWFTNDDYVLAYREYDYNENGEIKQERYYNHIGDDGIAFTIDDRLGGYSIVKPATNETPVRSIYYNIEGADLTWFTADDDVDSYSEKIYYEDERYFGTHYFFESGDDGIWFNNDDNDFSSIHDGKIYDDLNSIIRDVNSQAIGADNKWLTGDDTYDWMIGIQTDNNGNSIRRIAYRLQDITFFNLDETDLVDTYTDIYYFENSDAATHWIYYDAGINGIMEPDSDNRLWYGKNAYNEMNALTKQTIYDNPGNDLQWDTSDDVIKEYRQTEYDEYGFISSETFYTSPGTDNIWFNDDDIRGYRKEYGYYD